MADRNRTNRTIDARQSKIARMALSWRVGDAAKAAQVARGTLLRFEAGEALMPRTVNAIQRAYEDAGIEFLFGPAPGLRVHGRGRSGRELNH